MPPTTDEQQRSSTFVRGTVQLFSGYRYFRLGLETWPGAWNPSPLHSIYNHLLFLYLPRSKAIGACFWITLPGYEGRWRVTRDLLANLLRCVQYSLDLCTNSPDLTRLSLEKLRLGYRGHGLLLNIVPHK
jgi:hypothetical protein